MAEPKQAGGYPAVTCPKCLGTDTAVIEAKKGQCPRIRNRKCKKCGTEFEEHCP